MSDNDHHGDAEEEIRGKRTSVVCEHSLACPVVEYPFILERSRDGVRVDIAERNRMCQICEAVRNNEGKSLTAWKFRAVSQNVHQNRQERSRAVNSYSTFLRFRSCNKLRVQHAHLLIVVNIAPPVAISVSRIASSSAYTCDTGGDATRVSPYGQG